MLRGILARVQRGFVTPLQPAGVRSASCFAAGKRAAVLLAALAVATLLASSQTVTPSAWSQDEPLDLAIYEIQGSGFKSPYVGQTARTRGVVTADFLDTYANGFFIQDETGDGDPNTSDGIWIYHQHGEAEPLEVATGDRLIVTGEVNEHFGLTEILLDQVVTDGTASVPAAVLVDAPQGPQEAAIYYEAREGMLVELKPSFVVGATNSHGEPYVVPTDSGVDRIFRNDSEGRRLGLIFPGWWLSLNHGDSVDGTVGPMTFTYSNYKVMVDQDTKLTVTPGELEAPAAPEQAEDTVRLATYNLENMFDPIDDPDKNDGAWTPSEEQYERMLAVRARSIVDHLGPPAILGVQEVENLGVVEDLAERIAARTGGQYGAALIEGPDARGIDVGYIFDTAAVRLLSLKQEQACTTLPPTEGLDIECEMPDGTKGRVLFGRPPLVGHFETVDEGKRVNVIVNHFKSKRGGDAVTTPIRKAMAEHNLELLLGLKTKEPQVPVVIIGDLNDFEDSEPLQVFADSGLTRDLHASVPPEEDYSYIFNGVSQNLDYVLVEKDQPVALFQPMHVNCDFGALPEEELTADSQRASDHDPLLADLVLPETGSPVQSVHLPLLMKRFDLDAGAPRPTAAPTGTAGAPEPTSAPTAIPPTVPPATATTPPPTPTRETGAPPAFPMDIITIYYNGAINPSEPDEYIQITNVSETTVNLSGWQIISVRGDQRYDFPGGFEMAGGQTCRVYTNQSHPEHCGLSWDSNQAVWRNSGDKAEIRDQGGTLIDWYCYGDYEDQCG